jgi:secreted trypsin-like serine protease
MKLKAVIGLLICALAGAISASAYAVVNGIPVSPTDGFARSVVGVIPFDDKGEPGDCTGTMLSHRAVLTAAHCVAKSKRVDVVFDLDMKGTHRVTASAVITHPGYQYKPGHFGPGDLAILILPAHDYATMPMPLDPDQTFYAGQQFTIVGYGRDVSWNEWSDGAMRKAAISSSGRSTPQTVELVPIGSAWPCYGDSGGPILRKDFDGNYALTGVLGGGLQGADGCMQEAFMTPTATYAQWIRDTAAQAQ